MVVGAVWPTDESCSVHSEQRRFLFSPKRSRPVLAPDQPHMQRVSGASAECKWPGREPDDLLPTGAVPPFPLMPSWRAQGLICLQKELRKDEMHILYSSLRAY